MHSLILCYTPDPKRIGWMPPEIFGIVIREWKMLRRDEKWTRYQEERKQNNYHDLLTMTRNWIQEPEFLFGIPFFRYCKVISIHYRLDAQYLGEVWKTRIRGEEPVFNYKRIDEEVPLLSFVFKSWLTDQGIAVCS